jgi:hypothetical protein
MSPGVTIQADQRRQMGEVYQNALPSTIGGARRVRRDFVERGKGGRRGRQSPFLKSTPPAAVPDPVGTPRDRPEILPHQMGYAPFSQRV